MRDARGMNTTVLGGNMKNMTFYAIALAFACFFTSVVQGMSDPEWRLWRACAEGRADIVQQLVRKRAGRWARFLLGISWTSGVDPNFVDQYNQTPLHRAAQAGHQEVVRMLLAAGARPNVATKSGLTPLHDVISEDHPELAKILLKAGADVNATKVFGLAPLFYALVRGNPEMVRILLDAGADVTARAFGSTPLHYAVRKDNQEMVRMLLDAGADPMAAGRDGLTPLDLAKRRGHKAVVDMLMEAVHRPGGERSFEGEKAWEPAYW